MNKFYIFRSIYRMYRAYHSRTYALTMAYRIAIQGLPF